VPASQYKSAHFELNRQSLRTELRQYSLPKVLFAAKKLLKAFPLFFRKRQAIFAHKIGSCSRLYMAIWQSYLAMNARSQCRSE
jgi:hypothetical protein